MVTCCKLPATSTANNILTLPPGRQEAKKHKKTTGKRNGFEQKKKSKRIINAYKKRNTKYTRIKLNSDLRQ